MRLGRAQLVLGGMASKLLGLLREVLFAAWFGTSETASAWRIAQSAFLLPTHALSGEVLSSGLLTLYRQAQDESAQKARAVLLIAMGYIALISLGLFLIFWLQARWLAGLLAPGAGHGTLELAAQLLTVLALATPFYLLSSALAWIETAHQRYGGLSWRPLLLNLGAIAGAGLALWSGVESYMAWGLVAGHVIAAGLGVLAYRHFGGALGPAKADLRRYARIWLLRLGPLLALPALAQASLWVERVTASYLGEGMIAALDYARFLCDTAAQLVVLPLAVVTLAGANGRAEQITRNLRGILIISLILGLMLHSHAEWLIRMIFARGAFDQASILTTQGVMQGMALAVLTSLPALYLSKALIAQAMLRDALAASGLGLVVGAVINLALWPWLGPMTLGLAGMAQGAVMLVWASLRLRPRYLDLLPPLLTGAMCHLVVDQTLQGIWQVLSHILIWGFWVIALPNLRQGLLACLRRE